MIFSRVLACAAVAALAGCATSSYMGDNYPSQSFVKYTDPVSALNFKVSDRPAESKLLMTQGDSETAMLLISGQLGVPPIPMYEEAAVRWLAQTGRDCEVTRSVLIIQSQYEIIYDCKT